MVNRRGFLLGASSLAVLPARARAVRRHLIAAPTTWYVDNVGGSDSNDGTTTETAFQTLAAAFDRVLKSCDFAQQPTFRLMDSATPYPQITLPNYVGNLGYIGGYEFTFPRIQGNPANNAAVRVSATGTPSIIGCLSMPWSIESLKIESTNSWGVESDNHGKVFLRFINFGNCTQGHMLAAYGGLIETRNDGAIGMDISGGTTNGFHMFATRGGKIFTQGNLLRINNTPHVAYFAHADNHGEVYADGYVPVAYTPVVSANPGLASVDGLSIAIGLNGQPSGPGAWP